MVYGPLIFNMGNSKNGYLVLRVAFRTAGLTILTDDKKLSGDLVGVFYQSRVFVFQKVTIRLIIVSFGDKTEIEWLAVGFFDNQIGNSFRSIKLVGGNAKSRTETKIDKNK